MKIGRSDAGSRASASHTASLSGSHAAYRAIFERYGVIEAEELDVFCRASGLAGFKRPRRYVFVAEIPKSPVGKLLRRRLAAGDYTPEPAHTADAPRRQGTAAHGTAA